MLKKHIISELQMKTNPSSLTWQKKSGSMQLSMESLKQGRQAHFNGRMITSE